jgi:hypothetical protein
MWGQKIIWGGHLPPLAPPLVPPLTSLQQEYPTILCLSYMDRQNNLNCQISIVQY